MYLMNWKPARNSVALFIFHNKICHIHLNVFHLETGSPSRLYISLPLAHQNSTFYKNLKINTYYVQSEHD